MKIKLALLDSDQNYLNRIVTAFNIKYADKLEIYSFTKLESAMAALEPSRIDVLWPAIPLSWRAVRCRSGVSWPILWSRRTWTRSTTSEPSANSRRRT